MLRMHCPVSHESLPSPSSPHETLTSRFSDGRPSRPTAVNFDPAITTRRALRRTRLMARRAVYRCDVIDQLSPVRVSTSHWPPWPLTSAPTVATADSLTLPLWRIHRQASCNSAAVVLPRKRSMLSCFQFIGVYFSMRAFHYSASGIGHNYKLSVKRYRVLYMLQMWHCAQL